MGGFFGGGASVANMVGATSSAAGVAGLCPAPAAGKEAEYLRGDATFQPATAEWVPTTRKVKSGGMCFFDVGGGQGSKSVANAYIQWGYIYIPKTKSYSNVAINITTGGANVKIKIGLYSINTSGDPDALQFETGEIDVSSTGLKSISITSTLIVSGWYFSCLRSNGSASVSGFQSRFAKNALRNVLSNQLDYSNTTYANALPNPWSGSVFEGDVYNPIVEVY